MALTAKQKRFIEEYLIDLNATRAYKAAGYSVKSDNAAAVEGHKLLRNPKIASEVQKAMDERSERTEITADMVLRRWYDLAMADPNELIQLRRLNCRHCHGVDYEYQWKDEKEYEDAVEAAIASAQVLSEKKGETVEPVIPSAAGGYGYDRLADPDPDCPVCRGEGRLELHMADTRKLGPRARLLYAGVKQTQAGIEIKMHDQAKALENVARHLGMFKDETKIDLTVRNKLEDFFK